MKVAVLEYVYPYDGSELVGVFTDSKKAWTFAENAVIDEIDWIYKERYCKMVYTNGNDYYKVTEMELQ